MQLRVGSTGNSFICIFTSQICNKKTEAKIQSEHELLISSSSIFFSLTNGTTVPRTCFLFAHKTMVYKFASIKWSEINCCHESISGICRLKELCVNHSGTSSACLIISLAQQSGSLFGPDRKRPALGTDLKNLADNRGLEKLIGVSAGHTGVQQGSRAITGMRTVVGPPGNRLGPVWKCWKQTLKCDTC